MIIVLDCNIWISLTITKQIDLIAALSDNGVEIPSCQTLRDEIADVLSRSKLKKFIDSKTTEKIIQFHDLVTQMYSLDYIPNIVADEKDDYLFALCDKSIANYFVTGDKLLLTEKSYKDTEIITLSHLKQLFK